MQYFHHSSIKNYTIALLDLFDDIHVPRFNSNGDRINDIKIPIKFGSKEKAYMLSEHDMENLHNGNVNTLPRMVLAYDGMSKAQDRDTNKSHKINRRKKDDNSLIEQFHYNAVAYDFNFTIYIATRTFTDATIIIEQIAPMFRPDISLKIWELDIQSEPTTVPVAIGDFDVSLPEDMGEDEIRIIEVNFPLTLKGNLYLPIKDSGLIKEIKINMNIIESKRNDKAIKFGLDYDENIKYKASSLEVTSDKENE
jgi:hypothetical protein